MVDKVRGKLVADFGNALVTTTPGGPLRNLGMLSVGFDSGPGPVSLGEVVYTAPDFYTVRAGVVEFPPGRALTGQELTSLASAPVVLFHTTPNGDTVLVASEGNDGLYIRADANVFRINPGGKAVVELRASKFGEPLGSAQVGLALTTGQMDPSAFPLNTPPGACSFPAQVVTDATGKALVEITATDPGTPRNYIDGQVYGVGYGLTAAGQGASTPNPWDFVSVLIFTHTAFPTAPTWLGDVQPVLQQFQNLYPRMGKILKLGEHDSVVANLAGLRSVFTLDKANPNYMPATRDLSASKLAMILAWMDTKGPDGKPLMGTGA